MKYWNKEELEKKGYTIENVKITSFNLSMADHGVLCLEMGIEGSGWGCVFGGHVLGKGYLGASHFIGYAKGIEYLMQIMNTIGIEKTNDAVGKYIRVATKGWGSTIKIIGNIINDIWFDVNSFFEETNEKQDKEV